ncbi:glycosyltransferase family 4 protein [Cohnella soli]|uniref:Glycosyltransferase family 4 protein n=1 Tax=Cohnella soli TaxID=425005 RepID=A0ABW0HYH7_9BACL
MKIVIVAPEQIPVPPVLGGSVEIAILAVARRLAKRHSVTVISRTHRKYPSKSIIDGVTIRRVPTGSPSYYLSNVKRLLRGMSFDVLQIDNRPKFVAPLKRMFPRAKVSLFLHSLTFVSAPYASRSQARNGLVAANVVIANSSSLKRILAARFPQAASRIRKAYLGVDTSRFRPSGQRISARGEIRILFAGRLIPRKGVPVLLKSISLARQRIGRPIKVVIAGGAQNKGYGGSMRSLAKRHRVNARFLGSVPHSSIHRVFRQAHAFVCPSQKHEAFGLVNVEAMASGLPVIASNIGGINEVVDDGRTGYLVRNYRNPSAFADAIVRLFRDPARYREMSVRARHSAVNRFGWSATAARLTQIYRNK